MADKEISWVKNPPSGDGHHVTHRLMTATELAERDARQNTYNAIPAAAVSAAGSATLAGLAAIFWVLSLGDSALYTENQLTARSRATVFTRVKPRLGNG